MSAITETIQTLRSRIAEAAAHSGREAADITLVAVSKRQSADAVARLADCGVDQFGENQLPEGSDKQQALIGQGHPSLCWHFIGPLQSNKSRTVAEEFAWLQSLSRAKIARRLQSQRPRELPPINVLIQINIDEEPQKSGILSSELLPFADKLQELDRLRLRGIMIIPRPLQSGQPPIAAFEEAHRLYTRLQRHQDGIDTLSMGMSADYVEAIEHGSTMVRIGTALFGSRSQ